MLAFSRIRGKLFYGWVIVAVCCVLGIIIFGTRYSFGVFFKSIESEFELTRAMTSGVFSVYMLLLPVASILGGWALDRYGSRVVAFSMGIFAGLGLILTGQTSSLWQLFISYSVLFALGTGGAYTLVMVTTSRWFTQKRGLAIGITGSGSGLGTAIMAPFLAYLISAFGWHTAYIIAGLIAGLVIISLSLLLKRSPSEIETSSAEEVEDKGVDAQPGSMSLQQAFKTRSFWLLWVVWVSYALCLHLVLAHIVPHVTDVGISAAEAATVLGLIGLISVPGRLAMGWVSDRVGRKGTAIFCSLLTVGAMIWLIWSQELWTFYLFTIVYGFAYGGFDSASMALTSEVFGVRNLGVIVGMLSVGWGIGAAVGPAVAGWLFDISGSYSVAFLIGALAMLLVTLCVAFIRHEVKR